MEIVIEGDSQISDDGSALTQAVECVIKHIAFEDRWNLT